MLKDCTASALILGSIALAAFTGCSGGSKTSPSPVATVSLSTSTLSFSANAGTSAAGQSVTVTNSGSGTLTISGVSVSGGNASNFAQSNNCGTSLAPGASCAIQVEFSANAAGAFNGVLNVSDSAANTPQAVVLSAAETAPIAQWSAPTLTFSTPAESTSAVQTVNLTNAGNGVMNIGSLSVSGVNGTSFIQTSNCGTTLAPGASCAVSVSLTAFLAMSYSGSLVAASNDFGGAKSVSLNGTGTGTISLDTSNSADWVVNNGAVTLDFDPAQFHLWSIHLNGDSNDLADTNAVSNRDGKPLGFYMGNQITGSDPGPLYTGYKQVGNAYLDFWAGLPSSATSPVAIEEHFVVTANDPGYHTYYVVKHSATDIAGSLGLVLWQFRTNLNLFTHSYQVNTGLENLGVIDTPLPSPSNPQLSDPGRQVQNAVVDLHGITDPDTAAFLASKGRQFYTKYDYSTYEYLHKEHGVYGAQYGAWCVIPRSETIAGGPTKQDVDTLNQLIQQEMVGGHYVGALGYTPAQGTATTKLYGPVYFHFNKLAASGGSPANLYSEAQTWVPWFDQLYDNDATLNQSAYIASSARGSATGNIAGTGASANQAWSALSDPSVNVQLTSTGNAYWANHDANGNVAVSGVAPGTYRLSTYVLGQWGELRRDGITVSANQTAQLNGLTFTPENFGSATPIWTIGTPDRSAHEFLHGRDTQGNDFRSYQGQFDFWGDFAATQGQQTYYATAVGANPATNDPTKINYVQWVTFDPGLFAGIYNASDDTTDGYKYIVPGYVGAANVATKTIPPLAIHFTTTSTQASQGANAVLSLALAAADGDVFATLNGHTLIWHVHNSSDPMLRSGLSGYYQWLAMEWPSSYLNAPGQDNVLTLGANQIGWMPDAMRMEVTNRSSDPEVTGWHDYDYVSAGKTILAVDSMQNQ